MTTPYRARTTVFEAARETWPRAARIVRASPLLLLAALAGTACHTSTPQGFKRRAALYPSQTLARCFTARSSIVWMDART